MEQASLLGSASLPRGAWFLPARRHPGRRAWRSRLNATKTTLAPKRFTAADLDRIRRQGPSLEDVTRTVPDDRAGDAMRMDYTFVPTGALRTPVYSPEPRWSRLQRMNYMEFYDGLQRRNWTSSRYQAGLPAWHLDFFVDGGRTLRAPFSGYRVLVACPEEGWQRWTDLDRAGADAFLRDYSGGGLGGAIHRPKRAPQPLGSPSQYGFNQVFEQLFQAYEERLSEPALEEVFARGFARRREADYACPGETLLPLAFHVTPPETALSWVAGVPTLLIMAGVLSFLGSIFWFGIFRPRRQMPIDLFMALEFAQSKGRARQDGRTGVGFADVGGLGQAVHDLQGVVDFLRDPGKHAALGARPPRGVLLEGDPGTGKTLVAKAVAGEAGVAFYEMAGSEFVEGIVGVGAARVRDLFKRALVNAPCIVFVDEIDALGIRRADAGVGTNEEREQTLNQLLSEMDGFSPGSGVVFMAATNRADLLDPALLRPGRFDRRVRINRPDEAGRLEILRIHARRAKFDPDVDLTQLARDLPGLSGAQLGNVVNEAVLEAVRRRGSKVVQADVDAGVDRVVQGMRRPALPRDYDVRAALAAHEAGAAVASTVLAAARGHVERVERVSIVARGHDWSRTVVARGRDEDYLLVTRDRMLDRLRVVLAGRAAEEVLRGQPSTYAMDDLQMARRLAMRAVTAYGLSELGLTTYSPPPPPSKETVFYSFEVNPDRLDDNLFRHALPGGGFQPTDASWNAVLQTARRMILAAYRAQLAQMRAHRAALEALSRALLERDTVSGAEVDAIIAAHPSTMTEELVLEAAAREHPHPEHFDQLGGTLEMLRQYRTEEAERVARRESREEAEIAELIASAPSPADRPDARDVLLRD